MARDAAVEEWFKVSIDLWTNDKIMAVGRDGRDVFLYLLAVNRRGNYNGRVPAAELKLRLWAPVLGMAYEDVSSALEACLDPDVGLLRKHDDDSLEILGWDDDWRPKAKTNAERQARHRKRKKDRSGRNETVTVVTPPVTQPLRSDVTPLRNRDESNASNVEQRTENVEVREEKRESARPRDPFAVLCARLEEAAKTAGVVYHEPQFLKPFVSTNMAGLLKAKGLEALLAAVPEFERRLGEGAYAKDLARSGIGVVGAFYEAFTTLVQPRDGPAVTPERRGSVRPSTEFKGGF